MQSRITALLFSAVLVAVSVFAQQPAPIGSEFRVNSHVLGDQIRPRLAHQPDGGFIVVWTSDESGAGGTDTNGCVLGQRYNSGGARVGNEFQINTSTTYWQWGADVGTDSAGNFVVVWASPHLGVDGGDFDIFGQRFLANGSAVGGEFPVNTYTTGRQEDPAIAVAPGGEFVVVWQAEKPDTDDRGGIRAGRFAADATPVGDDFPVNTFTTEHQRVPAVAIDDDGDFVVVWQGDDSGGSDTDPNEPTKSISGQLFANDGSVVGGEFQVNTYTTDHQYHPSVAMDSDGDFLVVWDSDGSYGPDTNSSSQGQRYAADGTPLGSEFQVNSYITGAQKYPDVTMASSGAFVVVWASTGTSGTDSNWSVQMRRLSADGMPVGEDFQVNSWTSGYQQHPAVSATPSKELVVVWEGGYDDPVKYYEDGIWGQRFDEGLIFASSFESGDVTGWSATVP
jgi:hypothetical protein